MSLTKNSTAEPPAKVLVVDDDEKNRVLLRDVLTAEGYAVTEAAGGRTALDIIAANPPDVVLLDIMMPEIDGFEVCRRIKNNPATEPISVILVTALTDRSDRLMGIEAGANDFLVKPVDTRDVVLRVRNAARMKFLYDRVRENYSRLQEVERLRDDLTNLIVHDMKNPLFRVSGYLELLRDEAREKLNAEQMSYIEEAMRSCRELVNMVKSLLDVSSLEQGKVSVNRQECSGACMLKEALAAIEPFVRDKSLKVKAPDSDFSLHCDPDMTQRVLTNILSNAARYSPAGGVITIAVENAGKEVRISVADQGPGIPKEYHSRIFQKFGRVEQRRTGDKSYPTGLGLAFCKLAVEAHGGRIGVESEPGRGSVFWFTLPAGG